MMANATPPARPPYDPGNVFARILRGEIPCQPVFEDSFVFAFPDLHPQAPVHVLVIPKTPYVSLADFSHHAGNEEIAGFWRGVGQVVARLGLVEPGFRILSNAGPDSHQEVAHFHVHILAGRKLGPLLATPPAESPPD